MTTDITELAQSEINDALAQLKQISEYPTPSTQYARVLRKYILALVEALEKAQGMEAYWKTQCRGITDHCEELQQRITELESRTVTVKLPQAVSAGGQGYQEQVERILTAAGIKVEAE
ncbi:hypothetical protein RAH08_15020 [Klebsiella pneumoniae]